MRFETDISPLVGSQNSISAIMRRVIWALIPGTALAIVILGWGVLTNVLLAVAAAVIFEALMLFLRQRPVGFYLGDYSAVVAGWILGLCLPTLAPWWIPIVASGFAIVLGKQLYGGLGYNPFNPAMVGYVVMLVSFPKQMTFWAAPWGTDGIRLNFTESLSWTFFEELPSHLQFDAVTMATPLDAVRTRLSLGDESMAYIEQQSIFGLLAGQGSEWVALAFLAGGLWMIYKKIIRWHIPVAMLGALAIIATVFWLIDADRYGSPLFHLLAGGTMLGAFFVATDPISSSTTERGRLVFGAGVGILAYLIRSFGSYVDGVAFAVLLMNMAVPLIDYYTQPKVFGHKSQPKTASNKTSKGQ